MIIFSVDHERRRVEAVLGDSKIALGNSFMKLPAVAGILEDILKQNPRALDCSKMKGIDQCDPKDEFDEEFGRRVAQQRLLAKYHKKRYKLLSLIEKRLDEASQIAMMKMQTSLVSFKEHPPITEDMKEEKE